MQEDSMRAGARWIRQVGCGAIALLAAVTSTACLTAPDPADEAAITSELQAGDTALYKCVSPMCGGAAIMFDSRDLQLRSCRYDSRANAFDCEMRASDSPAMPGEFWEDRSVQLSCLNDLRFRCAGTDDLRSCVCTTTTAATTSSSRTYEPSLIRKRIDK
jgi:hypothetical protein